MKKFFIILICLTIAMPALARVKPRRADLEKWRREKEYMSNWTKCPSDKPIYTVDGKCHSCDDINSFIIPSFTTSDFCSRVCPNRKSIRKVIYRVAETWTTYCVLKDAPGQHFYFDEDDTMSWIDNGRKICPDDKPLYFEGKCLACNEYKNWDNVKNISLCEKCPNKVKKDESCYLNCPDDKPLILDDGRCMPCDTYSFLASLGYTVISGYEKCTEQKNTPPFKKSSSNTTRKQ